MDDLHLFMKAPVHTLDLRLLNQMKCGGGGNKEVLLHHIHWCGSE